MEAERREWSVQKSRAGGQLILFVCNKERKNGNCMKDSIFKLFNGLFYQRSRSAMSADSLSCVISFSLLCAFGRARSWFQDI